MKTATWDERTSAILLAAVSILGGRPVDDELFGDHYAIEAVRGAVALAKMVEKELER